MNGILTIYSMEQTNPIFWFNGEFSTRHIRLISSISSFLPFSPNFPIFFVFFHLSESFVFVNLIFHSFLPIVQTVQRILCSQMLNSRKPLGMFHFCPCHSIRATKTKTTLVFGYLSMEIDSHCTLKRQQNKTNDDNNVNNCNKSFISLRHSVQSFVARKMQ